MTATPSWTWIPIDDTKLGSGNNKITGISDGTNGPWLVGVWYGGSSSGTVKSFVASPEPGGYTDLRTLSDSNASSLWMWGRIPSSQGGEAGYFIPNNTASQGCKVCGVVHGENGYVTINDAAGTCGNTTLRGLNAEWMTVGYYVWGDRCLHDAPFEEYALTTCCSSEGGSPQFTAFNPPGTYSSAVPTGINGNGDVVGFLNTSSGAEGWFYTDFVYYTFTLSGATNTWPMGINWQDDVAGYYEDSSGNFHGFLVANPRNGTISTSTYETIDFNGEPSKNYETVVSTVDDCDDIGGWYLPSGTSLYSGFVGTVVGGKSKCEVGGSDSKRMHKRSMKGGL